MTSKENKTTVIDNTQAIKDDIELHRNMLVNNIERAGAYQGSAAAHAVIMLVEVAELGLLGDSGHDLTSPQWLTPVAGANEYGQAMFEAIAVNVWHDESGKLDKKIKQTIRSVKFLVAALIKSRSQGYLSEDGTTAYVEGVNELIKLTKGTPSKLMLNPITCGVLYEASGKDESDAFTAADTATWCKAGEQYMADQYGIKRTKENVQSAMKLDTAPTVDVARRLYQLIEDMDKQTIESNVHVNNALLQLYGKLIRVYAVDKKGNVTPASIAASEKLVDAIAS